MNPVKVCYYISGHGYGHAVRSVSVLRELIALGCTVWVKTLSPPFLFHDKWKGKAKVFPEGFDVGLVQKDNLRFDLDKTYRQITILLAQAEEKIEKEKAFLLQNRIRGVVCDIPFLPLEAARRAGIPSVAVGNFSWDWIYSHYARKDRRWKSIVRAVRGYYRQAGLLLRLPLHGEMTAFPRVEDIPLIARKSSLKKGEVRALLQLPSDRKIGLVSFSDLPLPSRALQRINALSSKYFFLIREPLNWKGPAFRKVRNKELSFIDLVRAADFVLTKPGYGIVSDCLALKVPLVYSDRGDFPEYEILVREVKRRLPHRHIPQRDLLSGRWEDHLDPLFPPQGGGVPLSLQGAKTAARKIRQWFTAYGRG